MNDRVADVLSPAATSAFPVYAPATRGMNTGPITQRHLETLGEHLPDGVAFTDQAGRILYWNDAMARLTGLPATACVGTRWDSAKLNFVTQGSNEADESIEPGPCPVSACLDRELATATPMKIIVHSPSARGAVPDRKLPNRVIPKTRTCEVLVRVTPVGAEHGGGTVIIVRDLSEHVQMQSQIVSLHKKAMSDPLTGVANRAEFDQWLLRCTTDAQQHQTTFGLIMCDIDHFKRINDFHGHQVGDEALIHFAKVLRRHTRSSDLVARYGGEEFAIIAVNSDHATASRRANEIRQAVAETIFDGLGGQSLTVSFGVAEYQKGDLPPLIVARADHALRHAKENGRNRVE